MPRHIKSFAALVLTVELCSALPLHAAPAYITYPIPVRITHVPEWFRPSTSRLCFTALSVTPGFVPTPVSELSVQTAPLRSQLLPVASWNIPNGASGIPANVALVTVGKNILPGDFIIECWIDMDDNGKFDPGEPYGCERLYGLTPTDPIDRIGIELMEVSPIIARMDLAKLIASMPATTNSTPAFGQLAAATDAGVWNVPYATVEPASTCGTNKPSSEQPVVRVRVARDNIDGALSTATLLDSYFDLSTRSCLTEAHILANDMYDLDFGVTTSSPNPLYFTNVTYRVVVGSDSVGDNAKGGNNLPIFFRKYFGNRFAPYSTSFSVTTNTTSSGIVLHPTFTWSHTNTICKPYPAFRLRIYTNDVISPPSMVYDSFTQRAPARDIFGRYKWMAPIASGMTYTNVSIGVTNIHTFASGKTYWWTVGMLDAKFTGLNATTNSPFVMPPATNYINDSIAH